MLEGFWVDFFAWIVAGIILIALYVYITFSWMIIAKKVRYKNPQRAFIPFANIAMWLEIGGFRWEFVFLLLIPILGWIVMAVLLIISHWKIYEKLGYYGWIAILPLIGLIKEIYGVGIIIYLIAIGIIAWKNK